MPRTRTYVSWQHMRSRCLNQNDKDYARYGGRGITVCPEWATFAGFVADMGERPAGTTLDRIEGDGDYHPGNCRWADQCTQVLNRSSVITITMNGRTQCLAAWCREVGISHQLASQRFNRNWPWEEVFSTTPRPIRKRQCLAMT